MPGGRRARRSRRTARAESRRRGAAVVFGDSSAGHRGPLGPRGPFPRGAHARLRRSAARARRAARPARRGAWPGSPRSSSIEGPPGIGKTALVSSTSSATPAWRPGADRAAGQRRGDRDPAGLRRGRPARPLGRGRPVPVSLGPGRSRRGGARRCGRGRHPAAGAARRAGVRGAGGRRGRRRALGRPAVAARRWSSRCAGWSPTPSSSCWPCATTDVPELPESLRRLVTGTGRQRAAAARARRARTSATSRRRWAWASFPAARRERLRSGTRGQPAVRPGAARGVPARTSGGRGSSRCRRRARSGCWSSDRYDACGADTRRLVDAAAVLGPHCPLPLAAALGRGRATARGGRRGRRP